MSTPAIELDQVVMRYRDVTALDHIDLRVPRGTLTSLLGRNGAGKTTAVRILATLERPTAGTARVLGYDTHRSAGAVRRVISSIGQSTTVEEALTGRENLMLMARLWGHRRGSAADRAAEMLDLVDLADAADRRVRGYSGGMRRRLDLAASLIGEPSVVFADEPTVGLDPLSRRRIWRVITERVAAGTTVLLTTQQLDEAEELSDAVCLLDSGRLVAAGSPSELIAGLPGDRVELAVSDPERLGDAAGVVRRIAAAEPVVEDGRSVVAVTVPAGAQRVPAMVTGLADAGIGVTELNLRTPTLEDVFLAFAGEGSRS